MRAEAPKPRERRSTEWAHSVIRERILDGRLAPAEVIAQAALADELGISRTPLREAMRLLQNEGLLEGEPNRRLRVAGISASDLEQLYAMRITNECLAIRVGASLLTDDQIEAARSAWDGMEAAGLRGDRTAVEAAHRRFHIALLAGAGERFVQAASVMWDHTTRYRAAYLARAGSSAAVALKAHSEHRLILDAAADGDGAASSIALARHYSRTAESLIAATDGTHEPAMLRAAVERVVATR